jgi:hypothetical protein
MGYDNQQPSIIDLTLTAGPTINNWTMLDDDEHHTLSDHKAISWDTLEESEMVTMANEEKEETSKTRTGWKIEEMDEEKREEAKKYYIERSEDRRYLDNTCTKEDIEAEAKWLEDVITDVLDRNAPRMRVCRRSKPWWNMEIKETRKKAGKTKRKHREGMIPWEEVRKEEKILYRTIRRSKRRS